MIARRIQTSRASLDNPNKPIDVFMLAGTSGVGKTETALALLGRLVVIPYYPLSDEIIAAIAKLQLKRIEKRIMENHKVPFSYDDDVVKLITERCTEVESGGRLIDTTGMPGSRLRSRYLLKMSLLKSRISSWVISTDRALRKNTMRSARSVKRLSGSMASLFLPSK